MPAFAQQPTRDSAHALESAGRNAEAEAEWRQLAAAHPNDPEPEAHIGLLAARQEHYADAIGAYRRAMALAPTIPNLRFNLGLACFKAEDYACAADALGPLAAHPENPSQAERLPLLLGMTHYGLAQYAAAIPFLEQAAAADNSNTELELTLAHACLFSHRFQCVLDAYHRLLTLNAESAETDMLAGEALDEMKDPVGAQREFRLAIAANPREPNVHFGLGYLLWTKGQYAEAAEQFQAEIVNNPRHTQAMLYLADAKLQLSQTDEAQALLETLLTIDPENAMQHLDLGQIYAERGRNDDALAQFLTAEKLEPKNVNAHWRLGRLYRSMGRTAEARAELEKARLLNKAEDQRLLELMSAPHDREPAAQK